MGKQRKQRVEAKRAVISGQKVQRGLMLPEETQQKDKSAVYRQQSRKAEGGGVRGSPSTRTRVCLRPQATSTARFPDNAPTSEGSLEDSVDPTPSCPYRPSPQISTLPSSVVKRDNSQSN
jgi:hypothetical protein